MLHVGPFLRRADHFHTEGGGGNEGVKRQHRQHGPCRARGRHAIKAQRLSVDGFLGDRMNGEVAVDDSQRVAMTHGGQNVEKIGIEQRIDSLEHDSS